jgi:putative phosphoesterase
VRIGLVSDTHGLLDPKLEAVFRGCELIVHGGDIVRTSVLAGLSAIAPVVAVRGNNDLGPEFAHVPETALVEVGDLTLLAVHDLGRREKPIAPAREILARRRVELVLHGHSHRPGTALLDGTLFVNPGSAGPRRFSLPRTAAVLRARGRKVSVSFFDLSGVRPSPWGEPVEASL